MTKGISYIQAPLTEDEFKEVNVYLASKGIRVKGEWIRELILREVRTHDDFIRVQQTVSEPESTARRLEPR